LPTRSGWPEQKLFRRLSVAANPTGFRAGGCLANLINWPDGIQERNNSRRRPDTTGDVRKKREELTQIIGWDSRVGVHRDADILPDRARVHALSMKAQPSVTALMELHNEAVERLRVQHKADLVTLNAELAAARANARETEQTRIMAFQGTLWRGTVHSISGEVRAAGEPMSSPMQFSPAATPVTVKIAQRNNAAVVRAVSFPGLSKVPAPVPSTTSQYCAGEVSPRPCTRMGSALNHE
jgi:hypothetical protein